MLGGSGITVEVDEKVAEREIGPLVSGVCVKLRVKRDSKGPCRPLKPENEPGFHAPTTSIPMTPGTFVTVVIELLVKWPNSELLKERLVGWAGLNVNAKVWPGMPRKTPV